MCFSFACFIYWFRGIPFCCLYFLLVFQLMSFFYLKNLPMFSFFFSFLIYTWLLFFCRILYDKRFSVFHFPVSDEDAPNYRTIIQNPMDMATLLQHVDSGQYIACASFLQDVDLIVTNAKVRFCCCTLSYRDIYYKEDCQRLLLSNKIYWNCTK